MCKFQSFAFLLAVFAAGNLVHFVSSEWAPVEKEAVAKLRKIIKDEELNLDYMKTDAYLLSWLRKHKFDVQTTAERVRQTLQWRKENKVDHLLSEDFSVFTKNYPFDVEGLDRQGRPVWISQIGKWDTRRIALSGLQDKFDRYRLYLQELMAKKMREENAKHPDQINFGYLAIVDLAGFNLRQHGCIQCIQGSIKSDLETEAAYPEKPYKSIMVNAPRIFEAFFRTITSLIPQGLYDYGDYEVHDFDREKWQKALLKYVAAEHLPTQYGGRRKNNLL